jgi:geranylgeranyl diphosphate synthase type I
LVRPALCLACCEAVGGDAAQAIPAAVAIELLHNFTLIHDDIEDASETRHGRPTLWRTFGVPLAINAGDGMFALAHRTLLRLAGTGVPAERVLDAARVLDDACIALCEGQHRDLGFETRADVTAAAYEEMIAGKTAALLSASAAIGGIAGGADARTVAGLAEAGRLLGLAFQVQDDVLGVWGEAAATGKPVADDIRARKKSYPVVWAFEHAEETDRRELRRLYASSEIDEPGVKRVLAILDAAGARPAARAAAEGHARSAIDTLRSLPLDETRRDEIESLAGMIASRSA